MMRPPSLVPTAGPNRYANATTPLAVPRRCTGTAVASSFETHGKPALSPMPSSTRSRISVLKECATPTSMVASAHTASPMPSTRCAPKRSAIQPTGICSSA